MFLKQTSMKLCPKIANDVYIRLGHVMLPAIFYLLVQANITNQRTYVWILVLYGASLSLDLSQQSAACLS